jgi:nucleotide-binding universal stress UspA family protein
MYHQILIATDGSELASRGVAHGLALAKAHNAPVAVVTVTEDWSPFQMAHDSAQGTRDPVGNYEALARSVAKRVLDRARESASLAKVDCECIHVPDQPPADGILTTAEKIGADLIVMSSHGRRGVQRVLLGNVANEVANRSHVPVLIVR